MRLIRTRLAALAATLVAVLTTVLAPGLPAAASTAPDTSTAPYPPRVILKVGGAHVVNIHNRVFAALLPTPPAARFRVLPAPGGVRFLDENTGGLVYAPTTEPLSQLQVSGPGPVPPNSVFVIEQPPSDETDDLASDELVSDELDGVARVARIRLAETGQYIGRHFVEDRSLLPKRVVLLPPDVRGPLFTIEAVR
ncbi:I66 family serine proteinase inhibitor [Streptosporangium sp. NPDC051022]|uniref:I66 family serine proteinase inhibitor n=1 Tax=Streptosporangium sp. NPDC051022 TaxID=3155752 RepID=UPI0034127299